MNGLERNRIWAKWPLWCASLFCMLLYGCFTGVENTPKIGTSEVKHQHAAAVTAEQKYLADIAPEPFVNWQNGKEFLVSDPKIGMIFTSGSPIVTFETGDIIRFQNAVEVNSPVGKATDLYFISEYASQPMIYRLNASIKDLQERTEVEIPFTVEMDLPNQVNRRLLGNTYYVVTPRWFDLNGNMITRIKYIPVKIIEVEPGTHDFPVKVVFTPLFDGFGADEKFAMFMSVGNMPRSSRNFDTLFALNNPRGKYGNITDETWNLIIKGRLKPGMTREEARLAIGAPIDVDRVHDYSSVYERWEYDGGVYLIFRDDILERFRL